VSHDVSQGLLTKRQERDENNAAIADITLLLALELSFCSVFIWFVL
jgi:hypothetical protein